MSRPVGARLERGADRRVGLPLRSTTHRHCGTVLGRNETGNHAQGAFHGATRTSGCAEPGDSGGPAISGDQAQGVAYGDWGDCSSGGETWFQPVNEILRETRREVVADRRAHR